MKHICLKIFLAFTIVLATFAIGNAQESDTLEIQHNQIGKVKFARFKPNLSSNRKMQNDTNFLKSVLKTSKEDGFKNIKEWTDELGITHKKFQQYYKGIKVENAEYMLHGKGDNIETINGDFQVVNISSSTPQLNEQQSLMKALTFVGAKQYKWEDPGMEKFIKQQKNNPQATYYPKGELLILKDSIENSNTFKLSWKFTISSLNPNDEKLVYVDAQTGNIIYAISILMDANIPCVSQTKYSGTLNITGDTYSGGIRLREDRNNVSVQTLNLHGQANNALATDFQNNTTNWTLAGWPTFTQDQVALDAHWGAETILDFWQTTFNRNSINGSGLSVVSNVHNPIGDNAYWDPTGLTMNYGDGVFTFKPLTSLDVCAHEIGHGITQFTAALALGYSESGALNEGFSDIWGTCVQHFGAPNKPLWLIGREIIAGTGSCLRNLQNPKDPNSLTHCPDTYHGTNWDNAGEPHINSTVLSHWFYLIAQGGSGTNDLGNTYNVNSIGIDAAQRIAFRTESVYLTSSSNYSDTRTASIQAARDLFGIGSCQEIAVTNGWYAVGIGLQYVSASSPIINGPNSICYNSTATYTITNVSAGNSITWSSSDATRLVTPSADGLSATVQNISSTSVLGNITINIPGCSGVISTTKQIALGTPHIDGNFINTYDNSVNLLGYYPTVINPACTGYYINTAMNIIGVSASGPPNVLWSKVSAGAFPTISQTGNDLSFYFYGDNQSAVFQLSAQNSCGTSTNQFSWVSSNCNPGGGGCLAFNISPNPANGVINVYVPSILPPCFAKFAGNNYSSVFSNLVISEINVYDNNKILRKNIKGGNSKKISFDRYSLNSGIYYVEIIGNQNYRETQTIIVQ